MGITTAGLDLLQGNPDAMDALFRSVRHGDVQEEESRKTVPDRFSVVVPAFNAVETLASCLESLFVLDWPDFEVIVVDDCSTDGTTDVAARYPCRIIRLPHNLGPGMARNSGAAAASGKFLAFTDADCIVPSRWLRNFAETFRKDPAVVAVTGGYAGAVGLDFLKRYQLLSLVWQQRHLPRRIESSISSNLACRRWAFDAVGGFPEYYLHGIDKPIWGNEDEELGFLLSRIGAVAWDKDNGVTHHFRSTLGAYVRQQIWYAERVILSHRLFSPMRATKTNYSRSGILLAVSCLILLPALSVVAWMLGKFLGCEMLHDTEIWSWSCCSILDALWPEALVAGIGGVLVLHLPNARFYLSQGMPWVTMLGAIGMDMARYFAIVYGSIRGVLLSMKGICR